MGAAKHLSQLHTRLRGVALVAVLGLSVLLAVKIEFRSPHSNAIFYAYGITVTAVITVTMAISFGRYRDPALVARRRLGEANAHDVLSADMTPRVSCIVAVHNERDLVVRCIASLAHQTYPNTEIIVVDDASTDGTREILRDLAQRYPIALIELDVNSGKKRALAHGLLRANGTIVAFSDSDTVWADDAIETIVPIFLTDRDIGAVSGHCRALNGSLNRLTKIQDCWYEGQFSVRKAFESVFNAVTCVSGPLAVFRAEAIYNFMPAWEEDSFLGQEFRFATDRTLTAYVLGARTLGPRIIERYSDTPFANPRYPLRHWKIVYAKSAHAWTNVPETFHALIRQQVRWKKSFIRNIFVTGRFYWQRPFLPALFYYVHVIFVLVGPFVAARHLIYMPLRGDPMSGVLYLAGIGVIGFAFGLAYRHENPGSRIWYYRPVMSLLSTLALSWLLFYSLATIKRMTWWRG